MKKFLLILMLIATPAYALNMSIAADPTIRGKLVDEFTDRYLEAIKDAEQPQIARWYCSAYDDAFGEMKEMFNLQLKEVLMDADSSGLVSLAKIRIILNMMHKHPEKNMRMKMAKTISGIVKDTNDENVIDTFSILTPFDMKAMEKSFDACLFLVMMGYTQEQEIEGAELFVQCA